MSSNTSHLSRVRALYKALLKLHRGLPLKMQSMGNQYLKDEFRLHKNAGPEYADIFMQEWAKYYVTLAKQLAQKKGKQDLGLNLSPEMLDNFQEEQINQLHELFKAATRSGLEKPNEESDNEQSRR